MSANTYDQYLKDCMFQECMDFYEELTQELGDAYERMDIQRLKFPSSCLVRKGDASHVSYYEKPEWSFRVAICWNWYAGEGANPDPDYIQCESDDLPRPHARPEPGMASRPVMANCVALFYEGKYHVIFGEWFDHRTRKWRWKENSAESAVNNLWYERYKRCELG